MKGDIVTASYITQNDEPIIYLRIRDASGGKHELFINDPLVRTNNFRPYFYAPLSEMEQYFYSSLPQERQLRNPKEIVGIERGYQDIFEKNMIKVLTRLPRHVKKYRNKKTAEDNIRFPYRFLIDKNIRVGVQFPDKRLVLPNEIKPCDEINAPAKLMYWDIEVEAPSKVLPLPENPCYPIVAISCKTEETEKVFQIASYEETEVFKSVPDEETLLKKFIQFVQESDVDALVGWNSNNYDEPYFFKRCQILGINYRKISPLNQIFKKEKLGRKSSVIINNIAVFREAKYDIRGLTQIDLLKLYKSMMFTQGEEVSWDLETVSRKAGFEYENMGDRIKELHGKKELAEYALNDTKATKIVNEKLDLIPLYDRLRRLAGCPFEVAHLNSLVIDYLCLRVSDKVLNNASPAKLGDELHGAYIMRPEPGLHENVAIFDLSAMYPSIMIAFNVSPETKEIIDEKTNDHLQGIRFVSKKKGILPQVVELLINERDKLRDINTRVANLHERAIKSLVCSAYGVFAFKGFRLYDNDCANFISSHGRQLIKKLSEKVEQELDTQTQYIDTDSLFLTVHPEKIKKVEKFLKSEITSYSKSYGAVSSIMDIKLDNYCEKLFFKCSKEKGEWVPTKKKYVYQENGEIHIKGFAPRRVTSSPLTTEIFLKFFRILFNYGKKEALKYLTSQRKSFRKRDPLEIAIPRGVNKPLNEYKRKDPWVEGLKFMRDHFNQEPRENWKAKLLYTTYIEGYGKQDCISVYEEVPPEVQIDWEKMRKKTIDDKFEGILKALDEEPAYILRPIEQSTLEAFK